MRPIRCFVCAVVPGFAVAQTWHQLPSTVPATAAVFDASRHRLLLVGTDTHQRCHEWDGSAVRERQDELAGEKVVQHLLWDAALARVIALSQDRWVGTWDGGTWSWHTGGATPPIGTCSVAFDAARRRLVVVSAGSAVHEWDGQVWWAIGNAPQAGVHAGGAFAYDPNTQRCLHYGGDATAPAATSSWDGFAWTQWMSASPPGMRGRAGLALDPGSQRLVLFGGSATATGTWTWTGTTWLQVPTTNDPGPRENLHLVASDVGLLMVATSGSNAGEIWHLIGATWSKIGYAPPGPGTMQEAAFVYDPVRSVVVGYGSNKTVLFDRRWLQATPTTSPPLRLQTHLAWSSLGQRVLLFGGLGPPNLADTWTWNGSDWESRQPAHSPSPRHGAAMAEDPAGGVLLFGGTDGTNWFGDQWHWDGTDWQARTPPLLPAARAYMLTVHDPTRGQTVVVGGYSTSAAYSGETWIWNGATWTQPATTAWPSWGSIPGFRPETGRVVMMGQSISHEWTGTDWVAEGFGHGQLSQFRPRLAAHRARGQLLQVQPPVVHLLTHVRADAAPYGTSCSLGPAPALAAIDLPAPDTAFAVELTTRRAAAPSFLVVGLAAQNVPLGGGCRSLVGLQVAATLVLSNAGGIARFPIPIPNDPSLRGVRLTTQGAVWDPAASLLGSATLTSGLQITIGD